MSASPDTFPDKHPLVNRVYGIDWAADLPENEQIASSEWTIEGDDAALTKSNEGNTVDKTTVWLDAGTLGKQYKLINKVETNSAPPKVLVAVKYINIRDR